MATGRLRALVLGAVALAASAVLAASAGWPGASAGPSAVDGAARDVAGGAAIVAGQQLDRRAGVPDAAREAADRAVLLTTASGCGQQRQASTTIVQVGGADVGLTNAHVVRGSGTVLVRDPDGRELTADVATGVDGRDAARLDIHRPGEPDRSGRSEDSLGGGYSGGEGLVIGPEPAVGSSVVVAGHPDGVESVSLGTVVSIEPRSAFGSVTDVLVIDVEVTGGSSGGAVLDAEGRVVGLVAARDPDTGDAVAYRIGDVLGRATTPAPTC